MVAYSQETILTIDKSGEVHPWSHLELNNDPDNFQFAIVTDRTGGHRPGIFEDAVHKLNLLQPEFVMSVGDMIEGYTRDKDEIYRQWDEFNGFIGQLQMPFFYVPGNHDYINDVMADIWKEKYGRSYYHFVYRDVLFLCLNSEEATKGSNMGGIEKEQYQWIKKVLEENRNVKWTLAFMHQPLWILDNTRYWPEVEKLLNQRRHTVFVGHHHHYVKYERNNGNYFMLATTGGASQLRGTDYGEFDHVVWVTMTNEGPVIANLLLDGIWDENVVTDKISAIMSGNPIQFEPVMIDSEPGQEPVLNLKVTNNENIPLDAVLVFNGMGNYLPEKKELRLRIDPNNVIQSTIRLNPQVSLSDKETIPLKISAEYFYHMDEDRDIRLKQDYNFTPSVTRKIRSTGVRIKVDGDPSEWLGQVMGTGKNGGFLSGDINAFAGKQDLDFTFSLDYDEKYVYAMIKVSDDEVYLDKNQSVWRQDALRFYIDGRPARLSISGTEQKNGDDYIGIFISAPASPAGHPIVYQKDNFPEGTQYAARVSGNITVYEIGIPVDWLNSRYGSDWKNFRLNIGVNDVDKDRAITQVYWMPEWRSAQNMIGSGLFIK